MRIFLWLSYDGTDFFGSQMQPDKPTVLGELDAALEKLQIDSKVVASGRTDRGVHATRQVCHVELPPFWVNLKKLTSTLNKMLPAGIRVRKIHQVPQNLHARYSAIKRLYRYILSSDNLSPFQSRYVSHVEPFEFEQLKNKTALFKGEWDFSYFLKQGSPTTSNVRSIYRAFAYRHKGYVVLCFEANGFLRTQIRFMVGALLQLDARQIEQMLRLREKHTIKPAPPQGLYLAGVSYKSYSS